jgi:tungsten cofactor oxidoreducase radical SAM maturase
MPKIPPASNGCLTLPPDFLLRRHYPESLEFWQEERNGELILLPIRPDIQKVYLEPTTACNLRCTTCIRNIWDDPIEHMAMETYQNLVRGLGALPELKRVIFTSFGEPFMHPNLLDMIAALQPTGVAVTIGTNGLLLNAQMAAELVRLGVDRVTFSIDGGKPETYAEVRGAILSRVIENINGLNEAKHTLGSLYPAIGIEFVALRSNVDELDDLTRMAAAMNVSRLLVSNVLPYTQEMCAERLYSYEPRPPFKTNSWAVKAGAWVMWATEELPRMHWGAERRCRFVNDNATVVGWDGGISPCYALSHNYRYFAIDGCQKQVSRYLFGNINQQSLAEIWMSEEYTRYRSAVKAFQFPSCPDCDLRETCDLRAENQGCWGWNPSCGDCLWAQDIVRCP